MTAPSADETRVPAYVALVRIAAVVGMSSLAAFGIFLIIGGLWPWGLLLIVLAIPCFFLMRLVEQNAEPPGASPP